MLAGVGDRARADAADAARRRAGGGPAARSQRQRRLAWSLALAIAQAALFTLSLCQSLTSAINSDGAANILQAQAMLHGNPLLRGWWTSDVSFYTTELPEYALVVAARGVSPDVVHICGALTYTLAVALAALVARGRATGAAGLRRAGLAVAIMLAPSILGGTEVFLENPDHFGTSVPVLLLLLLLDRGDEPGRRDRIVGRWYLPAAACALLAWTQVGDELSLAAATIPVAVVCACRLAVAGLRRRSRAGLRTDGLLLAAAVVSVEVGLLTDYVIRAIGGFVQQTIAGQQLAPLRQLPGNAHLLWQSLVVIFGANNPGVPKRAITISAHVPLVLMTSLHVIGLVLALAGLVAGIAVGFLGRGGDRDRVTQILVVAIGVTVAAAVFGTVLKSLATAHEVAILLPLGAVLAGRTLPPLARRLVSSRRQPVATVALAGWLAVGAAEMCYAAQWPAAPVSVQTVADWLVAHHQRDGLAAYWQAAQTTVTSGGRVLVAPVTQSATAPMPWEVAADWYRPGLRRATFVIAGAGPQHLEKPLSVAEVRARFGRPAAEYHVGDDVIMIYRYNLLTRLHSRALLGPP